MIRTPKAASQRRSAFSNNESDTGAKLPGEELMTCNTSAVAVCCSNASRVSVSSRAFSIAITACAAKVCNIAICLSVNGRTSWRAATIWPSSSSFFRSATCSVVRTPVSIATICIVGSSTSTRSGMCANGSPPSNRAAGLWGWARYPCRNRSAAVLDRPCAATARLLGSADAVLTEGTRCTPVSHLARLRRACFGHHRSTAYQRWLRTGGWPCRASLRRRGRGLLVTN